MHTLNWDDIRHFLQLVRCGSAPLAAQRLGINHTTVYRRIAALEQRLGKPLFERASNSWSLTPAGESIVRFAQAMAEEANNLERQIFADRHELSGPLRVTAADHCAERLLMPAIRRFTQQYPKIELEVIASANELDLTAREADIAIRGTDQPPDNVVGKPIARIAYAVYATRRLQKRLQRDQCDEDMPCITFAGDGYTRPAWIERHFPGTQRIYRSTSIPVMLSMAREGIGVALLPCVLADCERKLNRLYPHEREFGTMLWVLSHIDLRTTARVRIFRDFLLQELLKQKHHIEGKL